MISELLRHGYRALALTALLAAIAPIRFSLGDDGQAVTHGVLDGMSFVGKLGPAGKAPDRDDILYFGDGQFWSKNCVPCGFRPGPYFVRFVGSDIEFQGALESSERGRFQYSGLVRDGRISVEINWRKDRWYWSIDKAFRFEGELAQGIEVAAAEQATRLAEIADPEPEDCPL